MKYLRPAIIALLALAFAAVLAALHAPPGESAFPGANGKIAFATFRDGNWEIYAMNPDGSGPTNLTNNEAQDRCPGWSSDGAKIAFTSNRDGNYEIYVMNADGSDQTRLTIFNEAQDECPVWSPGGTKIAFHSGRTGGDDIYIMNADSSDQARLTTDPDNQAGPTGRTTAGPTGRPMAPRSPSTAPATVTLKYT